MALKVEIASYQKIEAHEVLFRNIRREVEAYMHSGRHTFRLLLLTKFTLYTSLLLTGYWLIFQVENFALLLILYTGMGYLLLLLGLNFAHDFAHNTIFRSRQLNNFLFEALFLLMGVNGYLWKKRHVHSHHNFPNMEGYDVDIELSGIIKLSPEQPSFFYHRFQHLYAPVLYLTYSLYWIAYKDMMLFLKTRHANLTFDRHPAIEWLKLFAFKSLYLGYIIIIPAVFSSFSWAQILAAFLVMHLLKSVFLLFTFLISHHVEGTVYHSQPGVCSSWLMHQISSANDFHPFSKTANFIFGGFNCHVAHHLFPSLPHPCYPGISRIIYRHLSENDIPVHQTSYVGGIISHLKLLKRLSNETLVPTS